MLKRSKSRWLFTIVLTICIMLFAASAALANTLNIDYNSGTEKKIVVTGPLLTAEQERVFSESELKQLFATDTVNGDLYHFTLINTVLSKRAYTLRGVSMFDVFDYCGIPATIYRNANYFLQLVCQDGFVQTIGPGVTFSGQGGVTLTGTLDAPRYSYSYNAGAVWAVTNDFVSANLTDGIIDEAEGREVPWVIAFAESHNSVADGVTGVVGDPFFPADGTGTGATFRPFFGQTNVENENLPLSGDNTYRLIFTDVQLPANQTTNIPGAGVFSLKGTMYDRATILTGRSNAAIKGATYGQKVTGSFENSSGNITYFEGTDVGSILLLGTKWQSIEGTWVEVFDYVISAGEYALFENAAGANVVVSYEEILADNYTLVYRTGASAGATTAIEREVGGKTYYFDLYRDGAPVVQNVSGISRVTNPMFTVTFDADNGSQAVIITVAGNGTVAAPTAPEKSGFRFLGWTLNGAAYNFGSLVTKNIVLVAQWEAVPTVLLGDVNGNGRIDISDARAVINHYLGRSEIVGAAALQAADVNKNSRIDISDARAIINHYLGRASIQ